MAKEDVNAEFTLTSKINFLKLFSFQFSTNRSIETRGL